MEQAVAAIAKHVSLQSSSTRVNRHKPVFFRHHLAKKAASAKKLAFNTCFGTPNNV
jgi:hypothetical protein